GRPRLLPILAVRLIVESERFDGARNAPIHMPPRPASREVDEIIDRRPYPARAVGIFIERTDHRQLTAHSDQRTGDFARLADKGGESLDRSNIGFDIDDSQRPARGIEFISRAGTN